jgi:hypothetical protein
MESIESIQKKRIMSRFGMIFLNLSLVTLILSIGFAVISVIGIALAFLIIIFLTIVTMGLILISDGGHDIFHKVNFLGGLSSSLLSVVPYLLIFSIISFIGGFILTRVGDPNWKKSRAGNVRMVLFVIVLVVAGIVYLVEVL